MSLRLGAAQTLAPTLLCCRRAACLPASQEEHPPAPENPGPHSRPPWHLLCFSRPGHTCRKLLSNCTSESRIPNYSCGLFPPAFVLLFCFQSFVIPSLFPHHTSTNRFCRPWDLKGHRPGAAWAPGDCSAKAPRRLPGLGTGAQAPWIAPLGSPWFLWEWLCFYLNLLGPCFWPSPFHWQPCQLSVFASTLFSRKKNAQAVNPSVQILCHTVGFEIPNVVRESVSGTHRGSQSLNMPPRLSFLHLYISLPLHDSFSVSIFPSLLLSLFPSLSSCFSLCLRVCLCVSLCLWKFLFILINLCVCMHRYI